MPCRVERQTSMYTVYIECDCLSATSVVVSAVDVHERGLQHGAWSHTMCIMSSADLTLYDKLIETL